MCELKSSYLFEEVALYTTAERLERSGLLRSCRRWMRDLFNV